MLKRKCIGEVKNNELNKNTVEIIFNFTSLTFLIYHMYEIH